MPANNPEISVEIQGLREVQQKAEQMVADLKGTPMLDAIRECTLLVERAAKKKLQPWKMGGGVDTGRLRASITPAVRNEGNTVHGIVGSNVVYAPYIELGTKPHYVPKGVLAVWAKRHHVSEWSIRRGIMAHGTRERRFLRGALQENLEAIRKRLNNAVKGIVRR